MNEAKNITKHACVKCNKKFRSVQGLISHTNKKTSCIDLIKCDKCNKVFKTNGNLAQHKNRKTSCVKQFLEEEKELLLLKHKLELEKISAKKETELIETELKHKLELEKISAKKETELIETELKHKLALEKIAAQKEKEIAIETLKLQRKEQTTNIINNNNQQTINDNRIQQINNYIVQLPSAGVISATLENCDNILKVVLLDLLESGQLHELYYKKLHTIPIEIVTTTYANNFYPKHKNIWYNKDLNAFYCVIEEKWNPMDREILIKILRRTFEKFMKMFNKYIISDVENHIEFMIKEDHFQKFPIYKKESNDIEGIAKEAFSY